MKIKSTKLLAILLAVCMMFSFSSVVFAANLPAMPAGGIDEIFGIYADLKIEEKLGLLHDVQETLKNSTVENETLSSFNKFYDEITDVLEEKDIKIEDLKNLDETELKVLEEDEELKKLMSKDKVTEVAKDTKADVEKAEVDVKELTGVVADAVIESDAIKPEQKVDLVEKVMENIGGAEVGGVAIPEKLLKVYEKVATYLDDQGKLKLMKQVTKLLDENASYPEIAKEIYAILSASEKFTLSAIVDIVEYVFTDVYNEEISKIYADAYDRAQNAGLIEKAVTALELAYSKLGKVTTVVEGIVTDQNELKKALLDEIDVAKVSFKKVIDLLNDANSSFNDVLGLRDELKAHLDVVKNLSYELSKEDLGKLIDDVHDLYFDALVGTRIKYKICGGTVNYVALGGTLSVNTKYAGAFETELAKKLPAGIYNGKVEMIPDTLQTSVNANTVAGYIANPDVKAKIEDANLITFNMDAVDALVNLVSLGDDLGWADYADPETIALAEKAVAKLEVLLAKKFDADKIAEVEKFAEKLAYTVVSYGVESYKALETIVELNPNAKIMVLGMVNPFADVSVKYDVNEETISLYDLFDLVIEATDIYNGIYAMFSENVTFVSVADAEKEYDYADITIDITAGDDISDLSEVITRNLDSTNYADAFALKKTNIVNALLAAIDFVGIKHIDEKPVDNKCDRCGAPLSTPNPFVPSGPSAPVHFNCDGGENCYCNKYTDLDNTMWYHQGVCYMIEHGYMIGIGDGKWAPEQIITRAEIATILWRIAGSEEVDYALDFSDVEADMWYTEAIEWAVSEEIFLGYGDGKFGPNDQITREQMVTVMYRYELDNGKKLTADFDMTTVSDADEISDWALEAMTWALDCGLIIGTDVDVLTASPLKTATRAEVAMIFYRKLDNLLK